jgi:hypothetical protein
VQSRALRIKPIEMKRVLKKMKRVLSEVRQTSGTGIRAKSSTSDKTH